MQKDVCPVRLHQSAYNSLPRKRNFLFRPHKSCAFTEILINLGFQTHYVSFQRKRNVFHEAKKVNSSQKWDNYFKALREYTSLLKQTKRKFYHQDLLNILRVNPRKFWNILTNKSAPSQHITLLNPDGSEVPVHQRSDAMNSYFCSIFTQEPNQVIPPLPLLNFTQMPPITITAEGIAKLIDNLKTSNTPGPDNIHTC